LRSISSLLAPQTVACEASQDTDDSAHRKFRICIVGGGLSGCLAAYLARQRFGNSIHLTVLERSAYSAGRFAAGLRYTSEQQNEQSGHGSRQHHWVDLGAQVLSVVDTDKVDDVFGRTISLRSGKAAWALTKQLEKCNMISSAPDALLAATEERLGFENHWRHFWGKSSNGLNGVLQWLLRGACPDEIKFNEKVQWVERSDPLHRTFRIYSEPSASSLFPLSREARSPQAIQEALSRLVAREDFDVVVVTTPSIWALRMLSLEGEHAETNTEEAGLASLLPKHVGHALRKGITHDQRCVCALVLTGQTLESKTVLCERMQKMFGPTSAELSLDLEIDISEIQRRMGMLMGCAENGLNTLVDWKSLSEDLHLVAWQNRKYANDLESPEDGVVLLAVHSTDSFCKHERCRREACGNHSPTLEEFAQAFQARVIRHMRSLLGSEEDGIEIQKIRTVYWPYSQVLRPPDFFSDEFDLPCWTDDNIRGLILAGEYWTHTSFLGSFASAIAAVDEIERISVAGI